MHTTNKWGFRGDEPPADWDHFLTIVTIGGSTTQCFYLDDRKTWPHLLQERLKGKYSKVWVGNAGLDGHSSRAHLIMMKRAIPKIKPDAVIFLVGINDLLISLSEDEKGHRSQFENTEWTYKFWTSSRLLQVLHTWKLILFDHVHVVTRTRHRVFVPTPLTEKEVPLPADLREALPFLDAYRRNIEEIIRLGKAMNIRTVFLTQPMRFEDTPYWRGIEAQFYWTKSQKGKRSAATLWRLLLVYNKELLEICKREKVDCFDLASVVPHRDAYFYDTTHFTERGAELVAQKVSGFLMGRL